VQAVLETISQWSRIVLAAAGSVAVALVVLGRTPNNVAYYKAIWKDAKEAARAHLDRKQILLALGLGTAAGTLRVAYSFAVTHERIDMDEIALGLLVFVLYIALVFAKSVVQAPVVASETKDDTIKELHVALKDTPSYRYGPPELAIAVGVQATETHRVPSERIAQLSGRDDLFLVELAPDGRCECVEQYLRIYNKSPQVSAQNVEVRISGMNPPHQKNIAPPFPYRLPWAPHESFTMTLAHGDEGDVLLYRAFIVRSAAGSRGFHYEGRAQEFMNSIEIVVEALVENAEPVRQTFKIRNVAPSPPLITPVVQ